MKPTEEQENQIADAARLKFHQRGASIREVALAAIERWERIRSTDPEIERLTKELAIAKSTSELTKEAGRVVTTTLADLRAEVAALKAALPEWIPLTERRPTEADGDEYEWVVWLVGDVISTGPYGKRASGDFQPTHWMPCADVANLPKRLVPTAEEIERAELESAYAEHSEHVLYDSFYADFTAGWKAARNKSKQS